MGFEACFDHFLVHSKSAIFPVLRPFIVVITTNSSTDPLFLPSSDIVVTPKLIVAVTAA